MVRVFLIVYFTPIILFLIYYWAKRKYVEHKNQYLQKIEFDAGFSEPVSLHPIIDPAKCLSCQACIMACPEEDVLGLVNNKVDLINPTHCIGHGACQKACPFDAIDLVFGTQGRAIDIPLLNADFETNVPGIFIAGELGGMGLIRNAVEQGRQAVQAIASKVKNTSGQAGLDGKQPLYDLIIVGAGPAGFAASLAAKHQKLKALTLEQESLGGALAHYPRNKIVITQPVELPLVGKMNFSRTTKERLIDYWKKIEIKTGIPIHYKERVEKIERQGPHFTIRSAQGIYTSRTVLLAIGRRGTPRTLGVKGEGMSKVVYQCIEPEQYQGLKVLIVGGGNSALEAVLLLVEVTGVAVSLSYRGEMFGQASKENIKRVLEAHQKHRLQIYFQSNLKEIQKHRVVLDHAGVMKHLANDAVIICAGGDLPINFLQAIGISVEKKFGTR